MIFEDLIANLQDAGRQLGGPTCFVTGADGKVRVWNGGDWQMQIDGNGTRCLLENRVTRDRLEVADKVLSCESPLTVWRSRLDDCWCAEAAAAFVLLSRARGFDRLGEVAAMSFSSMLPRMKSELSEAGEVYPLTQGVGVRGNLYNWHLCLQNRSLCYKDHLVPESVWAPHSDELHGILAPYWSAKNLGIFRSGSYEPLSLPTSFGPLAARTAGIGAM